jgi:hypothetical protein
MSQSALGLVTNKVGTRSLSRCMIRATASYYQYRGTSCAYVGSVRKPVATAGSGVLRNFGEESGRFVESVRFCGVRNEFLSSASAVLSSFDDADGMDSLPSLGIFSSSFEKARFSSVLESRLVVVGLLSAIIVPASRLAELVSSFSTFCIRGVSAKLCSLLSPEISASRLAELVSTFSSFCCIRGVSAAKRCSLLFLRRYHLSLVCPRG